MPVGAAAQPLLPRANDTAPEVAKRLVVSGDTEMGEESDLVFLDSDLPLLKIIAEFERSDKALSFPPLKTVVADLISKQGTME